jgi:hypothetical protein
MEFRRFKITDLPQKDAGPEDELGRKARRPA